MKKTAVFKVKAFPTTSETFVVNNVVEAIKKGFEVTVITDKKNPPAASSQEKLLHDFKVLQKTVSFAVPKNKTKRYLKAMAGICNPLLCFYFIKYIRLKGKIKGSWLFTLQNYRRYRKADVFHVHFATALEPLLELKKIGFLKSKIIVTFHGYDAHYLPNGIQRQQLLANFDAFIEKITVNSNYLKHQLVEKGFQEKQIQVVPIGVDTSFFKRKQTPNFNSETIHLITVARLVELKGIEYGIRVVKTLIQKGIHVNYTIVGEGPEEQNLKESITNLGLQKNVQLLGKKGQETIKELLETHQLFLMTSTSDADGRREAFGVVSLEAQAMQLPVIGFKSGGFPETVIDGKTGFLVQDKDVESMARAVEKLINDSALLQQMGSNARAHVLENFSFEKTTKKYLDLYQ